MRSVITLITLGVDDLSVTTDWGGYSGVFADPDGHRWDVAHNQFWPLNEDGRSVLPE
ncbi:MAG: hypothetical protein ACT4NY_10840 [Pseudonocardiales bacterium]